MATFAIGALVGKVSDFHELATVRLIAPGIIRSIPIRILAASRSIFTETISAESILYFAAIPEIVSPETTVCTTPETGGILRTCPIFNSSSNVRSFAHKIASVLTPYLLDILCTLSSALTVCFLTEFFVDGAGFDVTDTESGDSLIGSHHPIRINPVSEIYHSSSESPRSLYAVIMVDSS